MALFLLLLIWPIRSQSVLQAIKFGIELERPMVELRFGHNNQFIAQGLKETTYLCLPFEIHNSKDLRIIQLTNKVNHNSYF